MAPLAKLTVIVPESDADLALLKSFEDRGVLADPDSAVRWMHPEDDDEDGDEPRSAEWDESKHPRDEQGQFTESGGAAGRVSVGFKVEPWGLYPNAPKPTVTDEMARQARATLRQQGRLHANNTFSLWHVTLETPSESILRDGLIPGAVPPPGQDWEATHSSYATYFHQSFERAKDDAEQGGGGYVIEARIPATKLALARILPDEDVTLDAEDGLKTLLFDGGAVAVVGGVPAKNLRVAHEEPFRGAEWDESAHPRHPAGSPEGGQFAPAGDSGGSVTTSDLTLAPLLTKGFKVEHAANVDHRVLEVLEVKDVDAKLPTRVAEAASTALSKIEQQYPELHDYIKHNVSFFSAGYKPTTGATTVHAYGKAHVALNADQDIDGFLEPANADWTISQRITHEALAAGKSREEALRLAHENIIVHELGHILDGATAGQLTQMMVMTVLRKALREGEKEAVSWLSREVSGYAAASPEEAVAEVFAASVAGRPVPHDLRFVVEVAKAMPAGHPPPWAKPEGIDDLRAAISQAKQKLPKTIKEWSERKATDWVRLGDEPFRGAEWDEAKHPRHPAGSPSGGQFAPGTGDDVPTEDDLMPGLLPGTAERFRPGKPGDLRPFVTSHYARAFLFNPTSGELVVGNAGYSGSDWYAQTHAEALEQAFGSRRLANEAYDEFVVHGFMGGGSVRIASVQDYNRARAGERLAERLAILKLPPRTPLRATFVFREWGSTEVKTLGEGWPELFKRSRRRSAAGLLTAEEAHALREWEQLRVTAGFNPDQPRDESGKWTSGGGAAMRESGMTTIGMRKPTAAEAAAEADRQATRAERRTDWVEPHIVLGLPEFGVGYDETLRYLAAYGQHFESGTRPPAHLMGEPNECYKNASQLLIHENYDYAEGIVYPTGSGIAVLHAWNVDKDGNVIDSTPTVDPKTARYFGVVYDRKAYMRSMFKQKFYGMLGADEKTARLVIETGAHGIRKAA